MFPLGLLAVFARVKAVRSLKDPGKGIGVLVATGLGNLVNRQLGGLQ